jgi:hypothetical protein
MDEFRRLAKDSLSQHMRTKTSTPFSQPGKSPNAVKIVLGAATLLARLAVGEL